jgi:hypothetical protein
MIALDELAGLSRLGHALPPRRGEDDVVQFGNGDQVRGRVTALTAEGLSILPVYGQEPIILPLERMATLRLSRGDQTAVVAKHQLYLTDGSRLLVDRVEISDQQISFHVSLPGRPAQTLTVALDKVARLDFSASGLELIDLLDQPMRLLKGGEVFGLPHQPRREGATLYLHAPMTVQFDLPAAARRLAVTVELDLDDQMPADVKVWANLEVIVTHSRIGQPRRFHLHAGQRSIRINVAVDGSGLILKLDPGVNGPILDRVRLRDAMLLQQVGTGESFDSR